MYHTIFVNYEAKNVSWSRNRSRALVTVPAPAPAPAPAKNPGSQPWLKPPQDAGGKKVFLVMVIAGNTLLHSEKEHYTVPCNC